MDHQHDNPFRSPRVIDEPPVEAKLAAADETGVRGPAAPSSLLVAWSLNLFLLPMHLLSVPVLGMVMLVLLAGGGFHLFLLLGRRAAAWYIALLFFACDGAILARAAWLAQARDGQLATLLWVSVGSCVGILLALATPSAWRYYHRPE